MYLDTTAVQTVEDQFPLFFHQKNRHAFNSSIFLTSVWLTNTKDKPNFIVFSRLVLLVDFSVEGIFSLSRELLLQDKFYATIFWIWTTPNCLVLLCWVCHELPRAPSCLQKSKTQFSSNFRQTLSPNFHFCSSCRLNGFETILLSKYCCTF